MQATQTPLRQDQALQQNQFAALELALGQLNQLGNLNRQVSQLVALQQQQMAQQQFLAGLQQLLFELDQTARYLQGLRDQDPFAAGLLAHARLGALQRIGVHPGMLPSFEHKRLLADMTTFFQQLWAELQASPSLAALAGQFIDASHKYNTLQARLPYDAKGQLNRLRVQLEEDQRARKRWDSFRVPLFVVSLLALLCSGGVAASNSELWSKMDADLKVGLAGISLMFSALPAVIGLANQSSAKHRLVRTRANLDQLTQLFSDLQAFVDSEDGGRFLEQMMRQHPALKG